jgi:hypothetical protein
MKKPPQRAACFNAKKGRSEAVSTKRKGAAKAAPFSEKHLYLNYTEFQ